MRNYDNELNLYKKALRLTQDIAQAVSESKTDYLLKLLKRRRILFNQINEQKRMLSEQNEDSTLRFSSVYTRRKTNRPVSELQNIIRTIIKLDDDIKDKMTANAKATLEELKQIRNGQKLTSVYRLPVSTPSSKFVNKNIG